MNLWLMCVVLMNWKTFANSVFHNKFYLLQNEPI